MKGFSFRIAWVLIAMLALTAGLQYLGNRDLTIVPSIDLAKPGGASAFGELLVQSGYQVRRDTKPTPTAASDELIVLFEQTPKGRSDKWFATVYEPLLKWIKDGGSALVLDVGEELPLRQADEWTPLQAELPSGQTVRLATESALMYGDPNDSRLGMGTPIATSGKDAVANLYQYGKGRLIMLDGELALNRAIDQADNASFLMMQVQYLAKGKSVVFSESGFGMVRSEGLLRTIHPFLEGAWLQVLFLVLVVGYTLNIRFGLPEESRFLQRGSRELLDGVAQTMQRASLSLVVLEQAKRRGEAEIARQGGRATVRPELLEVVAELEVAIGQPKVRPLDALYLVRKLDDATSRTKKA